MSALRRFAKGQPCTAHIPGACNGDPATTVLAHIRVTNVAGLSQKPSDLIGAHLCSDCHDVIDGRQPWPEYFDESDKMWVKLAALVRTLDRLEHNPETVFAHIKRKVSL